MKKKEPTKKETTYQWSEICYKIDPQLSAPEKTYVFDNGNKIFYTPRKRTRADLHGNRKSR